MPKFPRAVKPVGSRRTLSRLIEIHSKETIRCPICLESLSLEDYVREHALECHGWDPTRVCIYCSGDERWPSSRDRDFKHIVPCLKRFLKINVSTEEEKPLAKSPCGKCKNFRSRPRDMCGRLEKNDVCKYSNFYESYYERPEAYGESTVTCTEESGLGRDICAIVKRFLRGDLKWYHLMVIHENFDNFVKSFVRMKDRMFLLPFWCLCDGLTEKRKTHRHMIAAFEPEAPFKSIWEHEVKCKLEDGGRSKTSIEIKSAFHLIRTIQYVSQRKASCDGKRINDVVGCKSRCSHFYINRPLHEHAIVCMSMMFKGGLQRLIIEQNKNKDVVGWLKYMHHKRDVNRHFKYAVPIGRTGFKFLNCVLPLSPEFEPSGEKTPLYLYWLGNKKLYLKTDPNLNYLTRDEWYARQMVKGNTLTSISEELYVLRPRQQNVMKQIKIALDEKEEMDQRIRNEKLRENDARIRLLEAEIADLKQEMHTLKAVEAKNVDLRQKIRTVKEVMSKLSCVQNESILNLLKEICLV